MMGRFRLDVRQASRDLLLVFVGLLGLNAAFFAFFVRPRLGEYRTLTTENAPRLQEMERREAEVRAREEYLRGLEQAENDLGRLRKEILSTREERMISVQMELAGLAQQFSVNMEQVQYQNEKSEEEGLDRFAMVVPLQGGYANLRRFIQAVENSDRFLVVERVALAEGEEGGVLLTMNITLATYFNLPEALKEGRAGGRRA